eukprot:TRINITY_DN25023_c0_g1_i1.p1 TRINITY_DN25023_c0_g1~~TRINITY_DN25023_c0_g1_i1.p1  ORF type:complete len:375 (+),score=93.65 TRINITY_DN25023_c0_g1_i1:38-1126(+)
MAFLKGSCFVPARRSGPLLRPKGSELEQLGVRSTYPCRVLPVSKIDSYEELKEELRQKYGKTDAEVVATPLGARMAQAATWYSKALPERELWMSQLPIQAKESLKYRLMCRAIGDVTALQKMDVDARGYWRLFSKGIISSQFWNSVVQVERDLSLELEAVKGEAAKVEPLQDPQGLISEAMQFVLKYGDKLPSTKEITDSVDALTELLKHLPPPPEGGMMPPGGGLPPLPPGMLPPGMMPPGGMPPGGFPGGLPPGFPGLPKARQPAPSGGSLEEYNWKQDGDEVEVAVKVPDNAAKSEVKVVFQAKSLKVVHKGETVVEGALSGTCVPDGSTWTLSKGRIVISLEKASPQAWPAVFVEKKT